MISFKQWKMLRESVGPMPLIATQPQILGLFTPNGFVEAKNGKKNVEKDETGDGETVDAASEKDDPKNAKAAKDSCECKKMPKKNSKKCMKKKMWGDEDDQPKKLMPAPKDSEEKDDDEESEEGDEVEKNDDDEENDEEGSEGDEESSDDDEDKDMDDEKSLGKDKKLMDKKPMFSKKNVKKESLNVLDSLKSMSKNLHSKHFDGIQEDSLLTPEEGESTIDLDKKVRTLDGMTFEEWRKKNADLKI